MNIQGMGLTLHYSLKIWQQQLRLGGWQWSLPFSKIFELIRLNRHHNGTKVRFKEVETCILRLQDGQQGRQICIFFAVISLCISSDNPISADDCSLPVLIQYPTQTQSYLFHTRWILFKSLQQRKKRIDGLFSRLRKDKPCLLPVQTLLRVGLPLPAPCLTHATKMSYWRDKWIHYGIN